MSGLSDDSTWTREKLLLVVDDDPVFRRGLANVLQQRGFQVQTATNGRKALDALRNGLKPALILLDMLMPVVDGWHFLRALREHPQLASIPVIIMTGTILTDEWAAANGCSGFLHKPIDIDLLMQELVRCLGESGTEPVP